MKPKLRHLPLAAAALVACSGAYAGYQSPDGNFSLSGFGTLGAAKSTTDEAYFYYPGQRGGATRTASLNPDSKLAVQGTYKLTPTLSGTAQVMTKFNGEGQYQPEMEWAFGKWQATPGLTFRAGRMGAPYFMISDFRNVGYANTAARPSLEVYGQVPVSQFDGGDVSYQMNLGDATITSTLWAGDSPTKYTSAMNKDPSLLEIKRTVGLNFQAELSNGISLRYGHTQGRLNVKNDSGSQLLAAANNPTLRAGLAGYAAAIPSSNAAAALASLSQIYPLINPSTARATFDGIGLAYDQDQWIFNVEYTKRKTKSFVSDTTGWYGLVGYRVDKFTPYVGLAKVSSDRRSANPVVKTSLFSVAPSVATGTIDATMRALYDGTQQSLNTQKLDQRTITVGSRWDISNGLALKVQLDHIAKPADSNGFFLVGDSAASLSPTSFSATKRKVNVLTISADFVF